MADRRKHVPAGAWPDLRAILEWNDPDFLLAAELEAEPGAREERQFWGRLTSIVTHYSERQNTAAWRLRRGQFGGFGHG